MREFLNHGKVIVCTHQAGAGAFLAALLRDNPGSLTGRVYAYPPAAPSFDGLPWKRIIVRESEEPNARDLLARVKPDAVLLGASVGFSLEKSLLVEARRSGIPAYTFVDHYWNLWQRFAHEKSAARWHYLPTRIYVIDRRCRQRIVAFGCPENLVRILAHPVLKSLPREGPAFSPVEVRRRLGIPADSNIALFISEWEYRASANWAFDQPRRRDVSYLLESLLKAAQRLKRDGETPVTVVIKEHPAGAGFLARHLREFDPSLYRVVGQFDKLSLLKASAVVFGLNSMLMLEAVACGRKVYSMHRERIDRESRLSHWNRRIKELKSPDECLRVLKRL